MTTFAGEWAAAVWEVLALSGPWLLLGFALAGVIKVLLPERLVYRHLGRDSLRSVFTASVVGVPIPLCSCSVLPTAMALRKSGASKGATTSFLISTPETGIDSIGITWALMDPVMTVARPLAALLTALVTGAAVNLQVRLGWLDEPTGGDPAGAAGCDDGCGAGHDHEEDHGHEHVPAEGGVLRRSLAYAFGPLLDDLTPWFLLGLLLSGLIAVLVPDGFFVGAAVAGWLSMLLMLVVGVPLYVCATASTPIAAALVAKGLDPGAALVFLLAGPATNIATIAVVRGFLGLRVLIVYLTGIAVSALACGALLGVAYSGLGIEPYAGLVGAMEDGLGPFAVTGGLVMAALLVLSARRLGLLSRWAGVLAAGCRRLGADPARPAVRGTALVVLALAWGWTGLGVVGPGETGFVTRFGRVTRTVEAPGPVWHLPAPFEALERVASARVRGLDVGTRSEPGSAAEDSATRARRFEVVTADETLLRVTYAVHYALADPARYRYGLADPEALLTACAAAALQQTCARLGTDDLLADRRPELEQRLARRTQAELDTLDAGLAVTAVRLHDVHAPDAVHATFRDVASAREDSLRLTRSAEGYRVRTLTEAQGTAAEQVQTAHADAADLMAAARGRALAFEALREAAAAAPEATVERMRRDALTASLSGSRLVFVLGDELDVTSLPAVPFDDGSRR